MILSFHPDLFGVTADLIAALVSFALRCAPFDQDPASLRWLPGPTIAVMTGPPAQCIKLRSSGKGSCGRDNLDQQCRH
ncbi:hypothetical protein [Synechococcus sp. UW179A]|uniref:hypothetical protein n=1 Tax=Synechococcus sp. UW179A TaxID=2575510 RepID=UPI000E0FA81C|nr:hypothetical protein [Synechococcus sp. UW179A]